MAERFKVTKAEQAAGLDEEAAVTGKLLSSEKHQGKLGRAGRALGSGMGQLFFGVGFVRWAVWPFTHLSPLGI